MNTIMMIDAFSNLDDDLVEKHFKAKEALKMKKANKNKSMWIKWGSVAACFCLILVIGIVAIPKLFDSGESYNPGETVKIHQLGKAVTSEYGTITLTESNTKDGKCRFVFEKTTEDIFGFGMRGYIVESRYTDENGVEKVNPIQYHIITPYEKYSAENEVASNHIVKDDMLKIIVNGQEVNELPTSPGTYDIVVDYSSIVDFLDNVSYQIQVFGFNGWFVLVEE